MTMMTEMATAKMTIFTVLERFLEKGKSLILILSTELYNLQTKFLLEPGEKRNKVIR
jgi:hypothetical protein